MNKDYQDVPGAGPAPVDYDTVIKHPVRFHNLSINYILLKIDLVRKQHPYKVVGKGETYSTYNEGWEDALNLLEQLIIEAGHFQMKDLADVIGLPFEQTHPIQAALLKNLNKID